MVTTKVAEVALATTVTLVGTVATAAFEVDRLTVAPAEGAGPESVTVPVRLAPPTAVVGAMVRPASTAEEDDEAVTVSVEESCSPFRVAPISAVAFTVCANVVTAKEAEVAPAGTVTEAGVVAAPGLELARATGVPPEGAAEVRVSVPLTPVTPGTFEAESVIAESWGARAPVVPSTRRTGEGWVTVA